MNRFSASIILGLLALVLAQCVSPTDVDTPRSVDLDNLAPGQRHDSLWRAARFSVWGSVYRGPSWPVSGMSALLNPVPTCRVSLIPDSADGRWALRFRAVYQQSDSAHVDWSDPVAVTLISFNFDSLLLRNNHLDTLHRKTLRAENYIQYRVKYIDGTGRTKFAEFTSNDVTPEHSVGDNLVHIETRVKDSSDTTRYPTSRWVNIHSIFAVKVMQPWPRIVYNDYWATVYLRW